jgi:hypothetical protein
VVPVSGDHLGILEPPNVTPLAQMPRRFLDDGRISRETAV